MRGEREKEREREQYREADRQTARQKDIDHERQADKERLLEIEGASKRKKERKLYRKIERWR